MPRLGRRTATLGLLAILMIALLASVPELRDVVRQIGHIGLMWLVAAVALELLSCVSFVIVFRLFFDRVTPRDARLLAWTEQASGALLPGGGVGGLAIGAALMRLTGSPLRWIIKRSAALFFLSAAVSSVALVGAGLALIAGARGPHDFLRTGLPTALAAVCTLLVACLPVLLRSRPQAPRWVRAVSSGVREAERLTLSRRPSWRLLGALGYLLFDIAVLWVALRSVGQSPSLAVVVLAYSIGYAANSLPVPGGIGVLDAGLVGALVLYGVSPVPAAAAVIVYHAVAFWIPSLGGLLAYLRLRPRLLGPEATSGPEATNVTHQPSPDHLASREANDASTWSNSETRSSRLGRESDRRPRARALHGAVR